MTHKVEQVQYQPVDTTQLQKVVVNFIKCIKVQERYLLAMCKKPKYTGGKCGITS